MKVTFSWYNSEKEHHTSEWDIPWMDMWPARGMIEEYIAYRRLSRENYELKKAVRVAIDSDMTKGLQELAALVPKEDR